MGRRKAREIALQILYQVELNASDPARVFDTFFEAYSGSREKDARSFAETLVRGVWEHRRQIDGAITRTAKNWSFSRITPVDRSILRMAVYEMLHRTDIPYRVTLNEAIELGKKYGTEKSGAFINGVLDNVLEKNPDIQQDAS